MFIQLLQFFFFFFEFRPGRKTEQTRMPTLQKPHKAEDPSPTDDPFPPPGNRSAASSRRAQGSGRTYPPILRQSGPEALTNPTAGSAMAVEQGLELHMTLAKRPTCDIYKQLNYFSFIFIR